MKHNRNVAVLVALLCTVAVLAVPAKRCKTQVRQPDGRYVGVITVYQMFEGMVGDKMVYRDTTKKDITIYVERKQTQIGGRLIGFWDVLLGDIRVTETTP